MTSPRVTSALRYSPLAALVAVGTGLDSIAESVALGTQASVEAKNRKMQETYRELERLQRALSPGSGASSGLA